MSYYTKVTVLQPPAGAPERSTALDGIESLLDEMGVSHDVLEDLSEIFMGATRASVKVYPAHVREIMIWISKKQPHVRYLVRSQGEDEDAPKDHVYASGEMSVAKAGELPKRKPKIDAALVAAIQSATAARPYSAKDRFGSGEAIAHSSFGTGIVTKVIANKIVVQFLDSERTLVHARA